MSGKVFKIVDSLEKRLNNLFSNLDGTFCQNGIIFGFTSVLNNSESYCIGCAATAEDIPFGNVQLGAFFLGDSFEDSTIMDYCSQLSKSKKSGKFVVLHFTSSGSKILFYDIKSGGFCQCESVIVDSQEALSNNTIIVLNAIFNFKFIYYKEKCIENIESTFNYLKNTLEKSSFCLKESNFKLSSESESTTILEDLYSQIEEFDELSDVQIPANMKKKMIEKLQRKLKTDKQSLQFKLQSNTNDSDIAIENLKIELDEGKSVDLKIPIKIIYCVQLHNNIGFLFKLFNSSLKKVLDSYQNIIAESVRTEFELNLPQVYNFFEPTTYCHTVTAIYSDLNNELKLVEQRRNVHQRYLLPMVKPTFKRINQFGIKASNETILTNVHVGLKSGIANGQCAIVSGRYHYFHYNQDQMSDSGWGCAYRSLQTIISWFRLQGYVEIDKVPNHKAIQQALVDVGDKPPNFVGTSKWIGSQEVCYVLSQLYAIESKIIFINSGSELANKARELIQHFNTNGTPIMIGGGVLAHTIIGVDFDQKNGDVKFLVLDPHYVGEDDISVIQKKGWCGWKSLSFWDKNSFYNLCLPQKPNKF